MTGCTQSGIMLKTALARMPVYVTVYNWYWRYLNVI